MVFVRHKVTGEVLEVFDVALDDYVFAGPPGVPAKARMVHRDEVEPDPFEAVLREGFTPWHDR